MSAMKGDTFLGQSIEYWIELQAKIEEVGPDAVKIIGALAIQLHSAKREIETLQNEWFQVQRLIEKNAQEKK